MKKTRRSVYIVICLILVSLILLLTACGDIGGTVTPGPGGGTTENPGGGNDNPGGGNDNPGGGNDNPGGDNPGGGNDNPGDNEHECYVTDWDITESTCTVAGKMVGKCNKCGETVTKELPLEEHTSLIIPAVSATCSATGLTEGEKCSVCNTILVEQKIIEKNPNAHKPINSPEKPATCTEAGYAHGIECELCGFKTQESIVLPALGHFEEIVYGKAATCTETGLSNGKYCTRCNTTTLEQTVIAAKGHTDITVPGVAATCKETGLTDGKKCSVCGTTTLEREVIPLAPHTEAERDAVAPTCTETGLTPIIYCSVCNDVLVSTQDTIPATGHTEKFINGKAATCSKSGLTAGKVCRDCGLVMRTQMTIPALGHDFDESHECGNDCGLTISIGLSYEESDDGSYYIVVGIGEFEGTELVIPEKYQGKSVLEIAEEAFAGEDIESVIILDGIEVIGEGAFDGCSSLESVTVPASVTVVGSDAFNDCELLVTINSASFEQMDSWADDFFGNSNFQVTSTVKGNLSPYQIYVEALSTLQRHIDNYTMYNHSKSYMSYPGYGEELMLEIIQTVKNNGRNFYNYQKEIDHGYIDPSTGMPYAKESTMYYVNQRAYLDDEKNKKVSLYAGYEYLRANSVGNGIDKMLQDEKFFDDAIFYRNLDGTYYLKLIMNPDEMGDLLGSLMGDAIPPEQAAMLTVEHAEYTYGFTADGAISSCDSDVKCMLGGVMGIRAVNDLDFYNIGTTTVSAPYGYTFYNIPACNSHPENYIVDVPATEPGCLYLGNTAGQYCKYCLRDVTSSSTIPEKGHTIINGICADCGYVKYSSPLAYELSTDQTYYTVIGLGSVAPDVLTIPESYNGLPVRYIAADAFKNNALVKEVVIPSSIVEIGKGAFEGCKNLSSISIPFVGGSATENGFFGYIFGASNYEEQADFIPESLKTVIINSACTIGDNAFYGCDGIERLTASMLITNVSASALTGCTGIKYATVPTSMIPALKGYSIEVLSVMGGTTIEAEAFKDITTLRRVVIGSSVKEIKTDAFLGCVNLIEVCDLSSYLNIREGSSENGSIGLYAAVITSSDVEVTYTVDGNMYMNNAGTVYLIKYNGDQTRLVLPASVNGQSYVVKDGAINVENLEYVEIPSGVGFENTAVFANCNPTEIKVNSYWLGIFKKESVKKLTVTSGSIPESYIGGYTNLETVVINNGVVVPSSAFFKLTSLKTAYFENGVSIDSTDYLFSGCTNLENVTLPADITTIPQRMFQGCSSLKTIEIPSGVIKIGKYAFQNCTSLSSINFPDSLETIEEEAFLACESLESIDLNKVKTLGTRAFCECKALGTIDFGDSIQAIGDQAFYSSKIETLTLPGTLTYLGKGAFGASRSLTTLTVPNDLSIEIGESAFLGCNNLSSVTLGGASNIGSGAFSACYSLKSITIPSSVNSISKDAFYECTALETVVIENGVESIGNNAFYKARNIKEIIIPASITSIGDYAFAYCTNLETVTFGNGLKTIGERAFLDCEKISAINLPEGLQTIGARAFNKVSLITELIIPASVTSVGADAFKSATNLSTLTVSNPSQLSSFNLSKVTKLTINGSGTIGGSVLANATAIEELYVAKTISTIESGAFSTLTSLKSLTVPFLGTTSTDTNKAYLGNLFGATASSQNKSTVPASLTYLKLDGTAMLYTNSLEGCSSLKTIVIGTSVVGIGKNAFTGCTSLEDLTVPFIGDGGSNARLAWVCSTTGKLKKITITNATAIAASAFSGMTKLEEIVIACNISSIGNNAFEGLTSLKSINIPDTVSSIGSNAFKNCTSLVEITLPSTISVIPEYCFHNCTALKTVNTKTDIVSISGYAFRYCSSLESFNFSNSLTAIGSYAFSDCTSLRFAYLPDSLQSLGTYSFYGCSGLLAVKFGSGLTSIGSSSFSSCSSLAVVYNYSSLPIKLNNSSYGSIPSTVIELITDKELPERIETDENGLIFYYNGEIAHLIGYVGTDSSVELPEYYKGLSYDIYQSAFRNNSIISSISIPSTVTKIGNNAFYNATNLSTVTGGTGITSVGTYAFNSTPWVSEATETRYLGSILIKYAGDINSNSNVVIPSGTTAIYENAFKNLGIVNSITIPDSVTNIASSAFTGFIAKNVYAPAEVISTVVSSGTQYAFVTSGSSIPSSAFSKCKYSLLGVTLPETLKSIGSSAFTGCYKLVEIWNYSSLILTPGSSNYGNVALYAQAVYTSPDEKSKVQQLGEYVFYISDTSNILIGYTGMSTEITLPTLEGGKSYEVGAYAFNGSALTGVVIPDCVTKLGYGAFADSKTLASVTLGTGIAEIPDYAFSNTLLNSITINGVITNIGQYAFQATKLVSFNVPGTVNTIGQYAFYNVTSLNTLTLGEGIERIEKSAFLRTSLAELVIPSTVRFIGSSAFSNISTLTNVTCNSTDIEIEVYSGYSGGKYTGINPFDSTPWYTNLPNGCVILGNTLITYKGSVADKNLVIPSGVSRISAYAFYEQLSIESVVIPDSVKSVGSNAFYGCKNVKEITGPAEFMSKNVFSISTNNGMTHIVKVTITSGKAITYSAFEGASSLESLYIADSVETIGERAFLNCAKLKTVVLPANLKEIGKHAFSSCDELVSVTFKNGVTTIGESAFSYCEKLTSITIPSSVTSIGKEAFRQCTILSYVKVESEDVTIGADAFRDCRGLSEVYLPASQLSAVPSVYNYTSTITLYITSGTTIKAKALYGRTSIEKVVMCDTITTIEDEAFYACYSLKSISFSKALETIGASAFSAGTGSGNKTTLIETLVFPDSLRSIGRFAFYGSTKLTSVKFNEGLVSIGEVAFANCPLLTSVTLPDSVVWVDKPNESENAFEKTVTTVVAPAYALPLFERYYIVNVTITKGDIMENAFARNEVLTSVTLKEGVTSIGRQAFSQTKITSIVIPSSVKTIGICAFYGCSSLSSVTLNEGLEMIDKEAFIFCNLKSIVLPSTLTCVMSNAFESNFAGFVEYNGGYYLGTKDNPYFLLMRTDETFTEAHPENKLVASTPVYN